MIELLGNIIGLVIFAGIIYIVIKTKGTHPQNFKLEEDEQIIEMTKGDYWDVQLLISRKKSSGEFAFTNKRIIYRENFFGNIISVPYSEIVEIKKALILFFPVAFDVKTTDGHSYRFAMMKRQHYIDLINSTAKAGNEL